MCFLGIKYANFGRKFEYSQHELVRFSCYKIDQCYVNLSTREPIGSVTVQLHCIASLGDIANIKYDKE